MDFVAKLDNAVVGVARGVAESREIIEDAEAVLAATRERLEREQVLELIVRLEHASWRKPIWPSSRRWGSATASTR